MIDGDWPGSSAASLAARSLGILAAFLVESSFEQRRKHTSTGKRIDRVEETASPSDLDDKPGKPQTLGDFLVASNRPSGLFLLAPTIGQEITVNI